MRRAHTRTCISIAILLACCPCAFALDPSLDVNQYAHTSWKIRDGSLKSAVMAIAQTPDGYLWLGTEFGLARFDGVRFVNWQPPAGQSLPGGRIRSLLAARDGTVWIGTDNGLASWREGRITEYGEVAGQLVNALSEDRTGTVWAGVVAAPSGKLCAIRSARLQCYGEDGSLGTGIGILFQDRAGNLWAVGGRALWRWNPASPKKYVFPDVIQGLAEDEKGQLLVSTIQSGLKVLAGDKIESKAVPAAGRQTKFGALFRDHKGGMWIGTVDRGLLHIRNGRTDDFSEADGLTSNWIRALFEDREGNMWVATSDGLDRFREFSFSTISVKQGLSPSSASSVLAAKDGSIWIGTYGGLNRWKDGKNTIFVHQRIPDAPEHQVTDAGLPDNYIESLWEDDERRIWVSTKRGLAAFENGRFTPIAVLPGGDAGWVYSIVGRGGADAWVSANQALFRVQDKRTTERVPWQTLGKQFPAVSLLSSPSGGLYVGFFKGGLAYFKGGQIGASYGDKEGLGKGHVFDIYMDADRTVWAATQGGLSRVSDGRVVTLTSKNGLPCDTVLWMREDDNHAAWLYMPCGLVRISHSELQAGVTDPNKVIKSTLFDASDGIRTSATSTSASPNVTMDNDGKLWFTTGDGVTVIDPRHLPENKLPPPVHIEEIIADRKTYAASSQGSEGLRLPPRVHNLEIHYTALSLVAPEKVHFRVKLEGQDPDWREVTDRHENYTNLAPRHYRFRVMACNNSGVWNEEGATLEFVIPPAWYQTNWFRGMCVAAFLALLYGLYRVRVGQLRAQERKLRDVIETIPTFAWTALPDGSIDFANRSWGEYSGFSTENTVGSGWEAAVHSEDLKRHVEKWRASVANGERFENEVRFRRADGEYRWFLVRAVPLRDGRGRIVKWYGTSSDIEDRKRAEQLQSDLAHTNRVSMMGELAASISHELKQPIAATVMNANTSLRWLRREQPDLEEIRVAAERIVQDGNRAGEIIDRLRSLYKKAPPRRELVDLNEIVRDMAGLLRGEASRFAVSIRAQLSPAIPKVTADRVQLQQVLMNLMLNAIEAMKETGGVLMMESQLDQDERVMISVSDTGVGLPTAKVDEIFSAFFTTKSQGSGMGLAISRSIVESHGGRLWATANDGRGATFHFTLPSAAQNERGGCGR